MIKFGLLGKEAFCNQAIYYLRKIEKHLTKSDYFEYDLHIITQNLLKFEDNIFINTDNI